MALKETSGFKIYFSCIVIVANTSKFQINSSDADNRSLMFATEAVISYMNRQILDDALI